MSAVSRFRQRGQGNSGLVFGAFALIALFFLLTEHRAHLLGWLPFLLLLACPLLHLFHGHGGHAPHGEDARSAPEEGKADGKTVSAPDASGSSHHH